MHNTIAIFKKQIKDTLKNKSVFIQFIMFPVLTLIMNHTIKIEGMPENFFVFLFATMYIGMAPLTSIAAVISEEKEKNTLRVLLMSNVKPWEYLFGVGIYIWFICMLGAAVICFAGSYDPGERMTFMLIMAIGILASLLIGAAIGTLSKTQMMATSITVPVMMVFSFLPMLSLFDERIEKAAHYVYSQQISLMLGRIGESHMEAEAVWIVAANMLIAAGAFAAAYWKSELA